MEGGRNQELACSLGIFFIQREGSKIELETFLAEGCSKAIVLRNIRPYQSKSEFHLTEAGSNAVMLTSIQPGCHKDLLVSTLAETNSKPMLSSIRPNCLEKLRMHNDR